MNLRIMLGLLRTLEQLHRHKHWERQELEAYQASALHRLRQFAYNHSPFYEAFHKGLKAHPLHELPVLTKTMLMDHCDDLVTDRSLHLEDVRVFAAAAKTPQRYQHRYWINATSGSSGQPGFLCLMRLSGFMS